MVVADYEVGHPADALGWHFLLQGMPIRPCSRVMTTVDVGGGG
jgi:hypothetical protein